MTKVKSEQTKKNSHKNKPEIIKRSPVDMDYSELDTLLDALLELENLPSNINYKSDNINYHRRNKLWIIIKALYRLMKAEIFYRTYMRKRLHSLKKDRVMFDSLKKTRCIRALKVYLYLAKVGLTDLMIHMGSNFDNKLFANFAIGTMLYDASFDIPECRKYLRDFDARIMSNEPIESKDEFLTLFNNSVDYLRNTLDAATFDTFAKYIRIEHISQLMSIYQLSDKKVSKESLLKITFAKGGISGLALMHIMVPKMKEKERKAIYELGAVMQLIDDISDIEEDSKGGIQTLPNQKLLTYREFKQLYFGTVNNVIDKFGIDPSHPNGTLDMLCWFADSMLEKRYGSFLNGNS